MSETVTKTLQATLATPTTGKEQRLRQLLDTYREALHDAFDAGANTMSAVNDIVTPYDLPYQAKDARATFRNSARPRETGRQAFASIGQSGRKIR